jgi:hypothetical protein
MLCGAGMNLACVIVMQIIESPAEGVNKSSRRDRNVLRKEGNRAS